MSDGRRSATAVNRSIYFGICVILFTKILFEIPDIDVHIWFNQADVHIFSLSTLQDKHKKIIIIHHAPIDDSIQILP